MQYLGRKNKIKHIFSLWRWRIIGVVSAIFISICILSCQSKQDQASSSGAAHKITETAPVTEAEENYRVAKEKYLANPEDPDALIWYGRRTAYLGHYPEAIEIYSEGIEKHPNDARMYRHRGHRFITLRQYEDAIKDFEKAVTLIEGQEDQIEPDGLPNERNIPLSTLHGNIWYHLGLAYYLKNDMANALRAYSNRTVTERYDDNIVSGGHWLYMILRRVEKKEEAEAAIRAVNTEMDIIENRSYYKMCLFYKGLITKEDLKPEGASSPSNDVLSYGLGNWYLYDQQDTAKARDHYQYLLENGNKQSFAYLAAESDWNRLFED